MQIEGLPLEGGKALFEAAKEGNAAALRRLLSDKAGEDLARKQQGDGTTVVHCASGKEVVDLLVERLGAESLRVKDSDGWLPLHHAAQGGTVETVRALVGHMREEDVLVAPGAHGSALHLAVAVRNIAVAKVLASDYPQLLSTVDNDLTNPTCFAVMLEQDFKFRDTKGAWLAEELWELRGLVDHMLPLTPLEVLQKRDGMGRTAMHYASTEATARALLAVMGGPATVIADADGAYPLHSIAYTSAVEAAEVIGPAMPREELLHASNTGCTALHLACDTGASYPGGVSLRSLEYFMELIPDAMGIACKRGLAPVHYALRMQHLPHAVLRLIAGTPANLLSACWEDGQGLLHYAASYGFPEVVLALIERLPPSARIQANGEGQTPLDLAKKQLPECKAGSSVERDYKKVIALLEPQ